MPRICLMLVILLAIQTATRGLEQTAAESGVQRMPSSNMLPPPTSLPSLDKTPAAREKLTADVYPANSPANLPTNPPLTAPTSPEPIPEKTSADAPLKIDVSEKDSPVVSLGSFMGYRYASGSLEWIPGGGDQFGMFSIVSNHYQEAGAEYGLGIGLGFHFLAGPEQTDMPPRVYDFSLAYQIRKQWGPWAVDVAASVLAASDFEGNARKGILFPGHAVGFYSVKPELDLVFGVDYLDRGDIKLLPVGGIIWKPKPEMRFELVFPRPRAVFQVAEHQRLYVGGELGGGSWAIERVSLENDLATYRDLRVCIGWEHVEKDNQRGAIEVAYLFDRRLEYTSGNGNMRLDDAVMIRLVTNY